MRFFFITILLCASGAFAQAVDPAAHFPAEAITAVTQPHVPQTPSSGKAADVPASPKAPENPASVTSELWPANTMPVFVLACSQVNVQLLSPCRCIIESLMRAMTHREFMELSSKNMVDKDIRYMSARQQCAMKSQQKKP